VNLRVINSDVDKAISIKAKAKDCQFVSWPGQGQGRAFPRPRPRPSVRKSKTNHTHC